MKETPLLEHRNQLAAHGRKVLQICGIELKRTSELQRQICGAFLFGIVYAYGRTHKLGPPEIHALGITMLEDVLAYDAAQAGAFSSKLVAASAAGSEDTMNAILHRGIDGHHQLEVDQEENLRENLLGLFMQLNATYDPDDSSSNSKR